MDIIEKIDKLRTQRNWTVYTLSLESGLSQSTIASIYQRNKPPKLETLQALCDAFGITLAQFFCDNENVEFVTQDEKELLTEYRNMPTQKRKSLLELLK